jgi:hypothetical protein
MQCSRNPHTHKAISSRCRAASSMSEHLRIHQNQNSFLPRPTPSAASAEQKCGNSLTAKFDRKKQDTRTQNRGFCTLRSFTHFHTHLTISLIFSQHLCTDLHPYFCFTQFHNYLRIFLIFLTTTICTFLPTYASHTPLRLRNKFRSK